jgi:hypothetical protein
MDNIEGILHATYDIKTRGQGSVTEEGSPFQIKFSVKPTTPCVMKTSEKKEDFRQPKIIGRRIQIGQGSNGSTISSSSIQLSTLWT